MMSGTSDEGEVIMRGAMLGLVLMVAGCGPTESEQAVARMKAQTEKLQQTLAETDMLFEMAKPSAEWLVSTDKSLITDEQTVQVMARSQMLDGPFGSERANLLVTCRERELAVILIWPRSLKGRGRLDALMRFDDAAAKAFEPLLATDDTGFGWWGHKEASPVISEILAAKRLVVRATAYNGAPMDAEFNVGGLGEHMPALEGACPS